MNRIRRSLATVAVLALAWSAHAVAAEGKVTGTIQHKGKTVTLQHAYLIAGDNYGNKVRRVILSAVDIKDKITASTSLSSAGAKLREGISFELDESMPFVGYWMVHSDQSVQISAPLDAKKFATTTSTPQRVAGTVKFDESASGGPKVDVTFDATLVKEFR
jgi:hypothetical protein